MLILGAILVMWAVLLIPLALRKFRDATSDRSIASFHTSLRILKGSGRAAIPPAHRLDVEEERYGVHPPVVPVAPSVSIQPRPQLVLLRPDDRGGPLMPQHRRYEDEWDDPYAPHAAADHDRNFDYSDAYDHVPHFEDDYGPDPFARREAALRRRNILLGLVGAVVATGIFGFLAAFFWDLTIVAVVLLVAYLGLMVWAALRGSITISAPRSLGRAEQSTDRHVARAVLGGHDAYGDDEAWGEDDEFVAEEMPDARYVDRFDDGWWDEPRRAAAR
jgi:hypothetical protein